MQVEACGKVVYVNPKNKSIFHIFAENANKKYTCIYEGFLPVHVGDSLLGVCEYTKSGKEEILTFKVPPYVIIGSDKQTILENFTLALRGTGYSRKKGDTIYQILLKELGFERDLDFVNSQNYKKNQNYISELEDEDQNNEENINVLPLLSNFALHYCYEPMMYDPYILFSNILELKQFVRLCKYFYKNFVLRNLYLLGLNNKEINESKCNPVELYNKLIKNPYTVTSISLDKCDDILCRLGKEVDMSFRECGKIVRKISDRMDNGWTGVPINILLRMFPSPPQYLSMLVNEFGIESDMHTIYLPYAYEVETFMAKKIKEMINDSPPFHISHLSFIRDDLSPEQIEAIKTSLNNNISIITGSAGSGKSSVIKELVHNLESNGITYRVASFTGKAVARVREITEKKEPATLHMMISLGKSSENKKKETFQCLIIDEASMVTTELLYEFMKVYSFHYSIIFVGDVNQLPPISWGNLFESLIESKIIPTTVLKTIHRTNSSGILSNANNIVKYKNMDEEAILTEGNFNFEITNNFKVMEGNLSVVKNLLNILKNNGIEASKIVCISPYNRDLEVINSSCSDLYNINNRSIIDARKKLWRVNDRVINTNNNYAVNLMNGAEGTIIDLDLMQEHVTVQFTTGEIHNFKTCCLLEEEDGTKELNTQNLIHSFAVSVHRYQGSEIDFVIGYIPEGNPSSSFLNANLLYTLITRTKKMIWLIGDTITMLRSAITKPAWRCSNLTQRLIQ